MLTLVNAGALPSGTMVLTSTVQGLPQDSFECSRMTIQDALAEVLPANHITVRYS